ncbi:MAG: hypothetical protein WC880_01055 [Candidatus Paceibacterota bacterium]
MSKEKLSSAELSRQAEEKAKKKRDRTKTRIKAAKANGSDSREAGKKIGSRKGRGYSKGS